MHYIPKIISSIRKLGYDFLKYSTTSIFLIKQLKRSKGAK